MLWRKRRRVGEGVDGFEEEEEEVRRTRRDLRVCRVAEKRGRSQSLLTSQ